MFMVFEGLRSYADSEEPRHCFICLSTPVRRVFPKCPPDCPLDSLYWSYLIAPGILPVDCENITGVDEKDVLKNAIEHLTSRCETHGIALMDKQRVQVSVGLQMFSLLK